MASFKEILNSNEEELLQLLYKFNVVEESDEDKAESIAIKLKLREAQFICAIGFNKSIRNLPEIPLILGFENYDSLINSRNEFFTTDIYKLLTLDNILSVYSVVRDDVENKQIMEYLLSNRLETIEGQIEETVNSLIIDKYKEEMRAIYSDEIVSIDFVETRLNKSDSGFRALLNEVTLIVESKLIPVGDIFFREEILPQEKRKLLDKGLIPFDLIKTRLIDSNISDVEKKILYDYLKLNREN
ncbi:MAG TPA: hypothetical protein EYQ42_04225 [Thiotrichaceae bacterium]|jgi:hypothetical protein|nr:hypothetical protein [Thiotrichaceae bacterium]HIM07761.1 hypothetical protein [Gammaproteobacteria bacterium]